MNIKEMDPFFTIAKQEAERRQSSCRGDEKSNTGYKNLCRELEALAEEKVGKLVRRELKLGEVVNEWDFVESEANFSARFKGDYNLYLYASFFLYHWGLHVYSTEDSLSGVRFMIQASTYAGYWKGARERDEWLEGKEVARQAKRDSGKKVGEGRAAYFQPVRDELVRLLMAECPGEGWRFKTEAAKAVLAKLQIFIDANEIELKTDNLESTVLRWSSAKYPDVEAAFAQVVSKHS